VKVDVGSVSAQLARLAAAQVKRSAAVEQHGYRLRPVVDEATLARASRAAGIALPEEYRHFVTTVGDGGAGPYYGVLPLGAALDRIEEWYGSLDPLGRDCPLTSDISFGELAGKPDDWAEHVARLDSDPAYVAHYDRLTETYAGRPWIDGRLPIVDYGCGDWLFLVVRGERRGTVWVDSVDSGTGLYCLEVDFGTFYQRWVDAEVARVTSGVPKRHARYDYLEYGDNPRYQPV
jgi:hypothetical protein